MTDSCLTSVCLALHALGPLPLTTLALETGLPLPVLRAHLHNFRGERYGSRLALADGIPERVWYLLPPQLVADADILITPDEEMP